MLLTAKVAVNAPLQKHASSCGDIIGDSERRQKHRLHHVQSTIDSHEDKGPILQR